ncbi:MAG: DUF1868 domain-containing protein [Pseudomonadota bacterium]
MLDTGVGGLSAGSNSNPPERLGLRYDRSRFLPEGGNTVVCHLDLDAPGHLAVLKARARMQMLPGAARVLYTPIQSLHMTVFEGALDSRRIEDAWPKHLPLDAPMSDVTADLHDRLAAFTAPGPFQVRAVGLRPTGLQLAGATAADEAVMRAWRDALTVPFNYRHQAHDSYRFHMTFGYMLDWIPDDLVAVWDAAMQEILADLIAEAPVMPLQRPAFCTFDDMTHFAPLRVF